MLKNLRMYEYNKTFKFALFQKCIQFRKLTIDSLKNIEKLHTQIFVHIQLYTYCMFIKIFTKMENQIVFFFWYLT